MLHFPSPGIGMLGRRQRHARGHRIPVAITSSPVPAPGHDTAVVVDDFGTDEVLLAGGCACCTVRDKLQTALRRLSAEREQGRHVSRVVIETNNDLGPILRTFVTERALGAEFYVEEEPIPPTFDGIHHFVLTEDLPLSWEAFSRFFSTLVMLRGIDLLHVKGLLNVTGCRGPVVVQFMQHLAHRPVELQVWPDNDRASRVEFITRGIEEKAVRSLLESVRTLSTSS
jgi:G3E family GTPase